MGDARYTEDRENQRVSALLMLLYVLIPPTTAARYGFLFLSVLIVSCELKLKAVHFALP